MKYKMVAYINGMAFYRELTRLDVLDLFNSGYTFRINKSTKFNRYLEIYLRRNNVNQFIGTLIYYK